MIRNLPTKCASVIDHLYFPLCVLFFLALLYNHFQIITYKVPLDYNEAGMLTITATVADGENPYTLKNQPTRGSGYPVLYNGIVAVASKALGNTLVLHRAIAGLFIFASCLLVFSATNKISQSLRNSFAAAILLYAGLLYYATPIASPTSVGLFLFLSSLIIPWHFRFSNRSLMAALILGVMAFYGKQYCVASLGYITLYLFIAVSKKKALIFGFCSILIFLAILATVHRTSPYFLDNTIFAVSYSANLYASNKTMLSQLSQYGNIYLPLLIVLIAHLLSKPFAEHQESEHSALESDGQHFFNLVDLDAPLLQRKPDFFWYCFACSLVVIVLAMGRHPGNHLSYLFQIMSPFFLVGIFIILSRSTKLIWLYQILVLWAFFNTYSILSKDFSLENEDNWEKLAKMISAADLVYSSPIVIGEVLNSGSSIFNNGHTNYFFGAKSSPSFTLHTNPEETVQRVWEKHVDKINSMIEHQEFDLIILDMWTSIPDRAPGSNSNVVRIAWLNQYYRRREIIQISLANRPGGGKYAMHIWEPIHSSSHSKITEP